MPNATADTVSSTVLNGVRFYEVGTTNEMIQMGFSLSYVEWYVVWWNWSTLVVTKLFFLAPGLSDSTSSPRRFPFVVYSPQCQAKNSEFPADSAMCGFQLVLAPQLPSFISGTAICGGDGEFRGRSSDHVVLGKNIALELIMTKHPSSRIW
jgi:hypothetical protein